MHTHGDPTYLVCSSSADESRQWAKQYAPDREHIHVTDARTLRGLRGPHIVVVMDSFEDRPASSRSAIADRIRGLKEQGLIHGILRVR
ncbi:hypothetical protein [Nocardiopsis sp. NPDC057823]|uniref:hypothetical protein n=1 Tax=Nocardiopsis sp. NPDC057823 TaxID=3346256 RepID=UPI003672DADF